MLSHSQRESVSVHHQGYSDEEESYSESEYRRASRWESRRTSCRSSRRSFDIEAAKGAVKSVRGRTNRTPQESPRSSYEEVAVIIKEGSRKEIDSWMYYVAGFTGVILLIVLCCVFRCTGSHTTTAVYKPPLQARKALRDVQDERPVQKRVEDMTKAEKKLHRKWEREMNKPTFKGVGTPGNRPVYKYEANARQEVRENGDEFLHSNTDHKVDPWLKLFNGPQAYLVNSEDCDGFYDYSVFKRNQKTDLPARITQMFENDQSEVTQRLYLLCKQWAPLPKEDIAFRLGSLFNGNEDIGEADVAFNWQQPASKLFKLLIHHKAFREFLGHKNLRVQASGFRGTIIQVQSRGVLDVKRNKRKNSFIFGVGETGTFRAKGSNGKFRHGTVTERDAEDRVKKVYFEDTGKIEIANGWEVAKRCRQTLIVSDINWITLEGAGDVMNNTHNGGHVSWPRTVALDRKAGSFSLSDASLIDLVQESDKESWPHETMKWGTKKRWWLSYNGEGIGFEKDEPRPSDLEAENAES